VLRALQGAPRLHARDAHAAVERALRRDAVGDDVHAVAARREVADGLQAADVRLEPDEDDVLARRLRGERLQHLAMADAAGPSASHQVCRIAALHRYVC
jgi:hypothetical protein